MNKLSIILPVALALGSSAALADTVAFSEDFNGDWTGSFSTLELDHKMPLANVNPLFQNDQGVAQPWWRLKDASASEDGFIGSHSAYYPAGQSNDWLISRAIEIPTAGFTLTFGAESYVMRSGDRLSDLRVYITEYQPAEGNLPSDPVLLVEDVPEGEYTDVIEKDFIPYSIDLGKYAGKTIYISFANLNEDKDILCLDNILVKRDDIASLTASAPEYVEKGRFSVTARVEASAGESVKNWKVTFIPDTKRNDIFTVLGSGESLAAGESVDLTGTADIAADQNCDWVVYLEADGMETVSVGGNVSGLDFIPFHRVLIEEATGMWCVNCPLGIYAMESMTSHPEMKDYVIPVSLHITQGTDASDFLCSKDYAYMSGLTLAPSMRIDRSRQVTMFSIANDGVPADPDNSLSVAHKVRNVHRSIALMDVDVAGKFVINDKDTTAIHATVTLRPAMTLPGKNYKVGFILTENNVGGHGSSFFKQENNFSGQEMASGLGGFTSLPQKVYDWRFNDVAREIYDFHGHPSIVLPEKLEMSRDYTFEVDLTIPDTRREFEVNGEKLFAAPAVTAANLTLIAFVLDEPAGYTSVNTASFPMTEQAEIRPSIAEIAEMLAGVEEIAGTDSDAPVEYYTLQGLRVEKPGKGIFIEKRGTTTRKVIF